MKEEYQESALFKPGEIIKVLNKKSKRYNQQAQIMAVEDCCLICLFLEPEDENTIESVKRGHVKTMTNQGHSRKLFFEKITKHKRGRVDV
jgi:hypothetical protein